MTECNDRIPVDFSIHLKGTHISVDCRDEAEAKAFYDWIADYEAVRERGRRRRAGTLAD